MIEVLRIILYVSAFICAIRLAYKIGYQKSSARMFDAMYKLEDTNDSD